MFTAALVAIGILAAIIAAVSGFGIGSLLTPAMTLVVPAQLAVAAVSIPHIAATAYRLWLIRRDVDFELLKSFGLMSAAGGLSGAIANTYLASRALELVLAALIFFVGIGGLAGWTKRLRFTGIWSWLAGIVSGFLGGLVGNQGGLRAGAMLGAGVSRDAFVATATATGLVVDLARLPVYLSARWDEILPLWPYMAAMTAGVVVGTAIGMKVLKRIPEEKFRKVVSVLLIGLALWLVLKP
jgi:uncharacterized protein